MLLELFLNLDEIAKGYATAKGRGGDDKVGQPAGGRGVRVFGGSIGDVVDEVLVVGVGQFLRRGVVDFREDEGGEGGGLRGGGGGVFS